ncbi:hypothetical protein PGT21_011441 [Puccinia graminis f. sp. tritici]|uniref:CCZ1/INTU/HSP4 first Longin domain-containing protein n=1 Tax=Puccinia graminis f. sp. tritici TaxID=56615 RepID=A0A5B0PX98_PUCGR|nr:hypothetical protein PGT21_011441 [Puccinia graminis f. sp. tritici]
MGETKREPNCKRNMNHSIQFPTLSTFIIWSHPTQQDSSSEDSDSVLYSTHLGQAGLSQEKKNRLIGLIKGLVNFTAILSHGLNKQQSIRVVHSKNHKILFLQPEANLYLAAVSNCKTNTKDHTRRFLGN